MSGSNFEKAITADLSALKSTVSILTSDVSTLKTDVSTLKTDVSMLKTDVSTFKTDMRRLTIEVVGVKGRLGDMETAMASLATKKDIERVLGAIDAFAGKSEAGERASILHGQALTEVQVKQKDHERRIKSLEARSTQ